MTSLDQFRDDMDVEGGEKIEAFRMDNSKQAENIPDMRKHVGLGDCNCCDRFFVRGDKIFIVEEIRLSETINNIEGDHSYLDNGDKLDFVIKYIRQKNYVKVYGSLLVLCRLAAICKDAANLMQDKKHNFWLVTEEMANAGTSLYLADITSHLSSDLRSVLSKGVIDEVEVIPSDILTKKLSRNAPPP